MNAGYVSQLLEQYRDNPEAVDPAWRAVFEGEETETPTAPDELAEVEEPASDGNGHGLVESAFEAAPVAPTREPSSRWKPIPVEAAPVESVPVEPAAGVPAAEAPVAEAPVADVPACARLLLQTVLCPRSSNPPHPTPSSSPALPLRCRS